jgi:hypothetical protein
MYYEWQESPATGAGLISGIPGAVQERIGYTRVWVDPFQRRLLFCLPIEQRAERHIDVLLQLVQSW